MSKIPAYYHKLLEQNFSLFDQKVLSILLEISDFQKLSAKTRFLDFGYTDRKAFYLIEGYITGILRDAAEKEYNIMLRGPNSFNINVEHLLGSNKAIYAFETITDSKILMFDFAEFEKIALSKKKFNTLYVNILKQNMIIMQNRIEESLTKNPEQRYVSLLQKSPELFQQAFNKQIAKYLGITPVSLSRIRKRVYHNHPELTLNTRLSQ